MKFKILLLIILILTTTLRAEKLRPLSYQAVIRNGNNGLISLRTIGMRISVIQDSPDGTVVYTETQKPITNINGLVTLEIGTGEVVTGNFATIDWSAADYFIKTETDPNGGNNYTITGTFRLLSVPVALYAVKAGNGFSGDYNDLINKPNITHTQSDWNQTNPTASNYILNKPRIPIEATSTTPGIVYLPVGQTKDTLATIAITGNYNDLSNKPDLSALATMHTETKSTLLGNPTSDSNQAPTEIALGSGLYFSGSTLNTTLQNASNGLTVNNKVIELGGTLDKPTSITTNATNTLSLKGLQRGDLATDSILVTNGNTGEIKRVSFKSQGGNQIKVIYTATAGQVTFATPYTVVSLDKLQVYRNGVVIDFTATIGTKSLTLSSDLVADGGCFAGDEIKITQYY